ncbi:WavE lipopolysaccharide synthesis family protein [uncultured Oceanisphaera sp.]|uniref:WavE lipopolysaccharide synthesis family protein n=1 Tax=uncultured Oceanisphaera sp. TaxID=353858 RepID=UPI002632A8A0|nr:WavE lipopolysaccharide synthesis family protein [uncultured Oceanisphaera sp.]
MKIDNKDISFVLQGPVSASKDRIQKEGVTEKNIASIRQLFPGSEIILSTWKGQDTADLDVDKLILLDDPGQNSIFNDGEEKKLNNNRQLYSSHQGLRAVNTRYATKVRTDNIINGRGFVELFEQFSSAPRDSEFTYLDNRIVTSSTFFISSHIGQPVYFHKSDLFDFGETQDLLKIWHDSLVPELYFRKKPGYKSRHPATEQFLCLHWISKLMDQKLPINTKAGDDANLGPEFWEKFITNNLIICEPNKMGLDVTDRFYKRGNIALEYDLDDWKYATGLAGKPMDKKRLKRAFKVTEGRLLRMLIRR